MLTTPSNLSGGILLGEPLNGEHPLNQGRLCWWTVVPQWFGGNTWYDLVNRVSATLSSSYNGWSSQAPPNGSGSLVSNASGYAHATIPGTLTFGSSNFTIGLWYKRADTNVFGTQWWGLGNSSNGGNNVSTQSGITLTTGSSGAVALGYTEGTANLWRRVLMTFVGNSSILYFNGFKQATGSAGDSAVITNLYFLNNINRGFPQPPSAGSCVTGFTIWNRVLSAGEVEQDFVLESQGLPGVLNRQSTMLYFVPAVSQTFTLTAATGTFTETGESATFKVSMSGSDATFTLTGEPATFAIKENAATGSFTETGEPATFKVTMPGSDGIFNETGEAATFAIKEKASAGSLVETGEPATFKIVMPVSDGTFTLTGEQATFLVGNVLIASAGLFAKTGEPATYKITLRGVPGAFVLTGNPVNFFAAIPKPGGTWVCTESGLDWISEEGGIRWISPASGTSWESAEGGRAWTSEESGTIWSAG